MKLTEPPRRQPRIDYTVEPFMYCPECGVEAAEEQQYCRGCGAGLRGGQEKRSDPRATGFVMVMVMLVGLLVTMAGKFADARAVVFLGGFIVVLSAMLGV